MQRKSVKQALADIGKRVKKQRLATLGDYSNLGGQRKTSPEVASKSAKGLRDKRYSKIAKSAFGSSLSQVAPKARR